MTNNIYHNFYVKAPIQLLEVPLPLEDFKNEDGSYKTIPEYLAEINHTVARFSSDGYFLKGFSFNYKGLKELEGRVGELGLEIGTNLFILTFNEAQEELMKEEWNNGI